MNHIPSEKEKKTASHHLNALEDAIIEAGEDYDFICPALLLAIVSRETWWGWCGESYSIPGSPAGRGDYSKRAGEISSRYHGFGFFQVDIGAHENFINTGLWTVPYESAKYVIEHVLIHSYKYLESNFTDFEKPSLVGATVAAYNAGPGRIRQSLRNGDDVDRYTAGHDYSKDVLSLREWWAAWLSNWVV